MGLSPGTSDNSSVTTRAGWQAAARRPPLIAERWRRTVFISPMVAPLDSSARFTACLCSSVKPGRGKGSERRSATRDQAQHDVLRAQALHQFHQPLRRLHSGGVGHGMRSFRNLDAPTRHRVTIARHHQARQRAAPMVLHRARHGGRGLARAYDHQPPASQFGRCGQVRRYATGGLRRRHGGVEHLAQQRRGRDLRVDAVGASGQHGASGEWVRWCPETSPYGPPAHRRPLSRAPLR